jgi:uncharacterized protein
MKVAVAGATGFVGSRLVERLLSEGHQVVVLTRNAANAPKNVEVVTYNPMESGEWQDAIAGCDGVVNLAGHQNVNSH